MNDDAIYNHIEEMEIHKREFEHLNKMISEYEKRIKQGIFNLKIEWNTDISKIDLSVLKDKLNDEIINRLKNDYCIKELLLNKVVGNYCTNPDEIFPLDNLWQIRQEHNIARLIDYVENHDDVIPPIIKPMEESSLSIIDGHHRIALSRYLKLERIPFIIEKKYLKFADELL